MEPSQDDEEQLTFDLFMIPPESEPQCTNDKQPSSRARGKGRGRGRGRGRGPSREPKKLFCHFHGPDSDHRTNQSPEKKTIERMESEKKSQASWAYYMASDSTNTTPANTVHTTSVCPTTSIHPNIPPARIQLQLQPQLATATNPTNTTKSTPYSSSADTGAATPTSNPPTKAREPNHK